MDEVKEAPLLLNKTLSLSWPNEISLTLNLGNQTWLDLGDGALWANFSCLLFIFPEHYHDGCVIQKTNHLLSQGMSLQLKIQRKREYFPS